MTSPFLTIASIGVTPHPTNVFIVSDTEPTFRDNGGDLQQGDRWFDEAVSVESIYVDQRWVAMSKSLSK